MLTASPIARPPGIWTPGRGYAPPRPAFRPRQPIGRPLRRRHRPGCPLHRPEFLAMADGDTSLDSNGDTILDANGDEYLKCCCGPKCGACSKNTDLSNMVFLLVFEGVTPRTYCNNGRKFVGDPNGSYVVPIPSSGGSSCTNYVVVSTGATPYPRQEIYPANDCTGTVSYAVCAVFLHLAMAFTESGVAVTRVAAWYSPGSGYAFWDHAEGADWDCTSITLSNNRADYGLGYYNPSQGFGDGGTCTITRIA